MTSHKIVQTIRQLFWVSRPVSWVNTAFPFAAGYLMVHRSIDAWWVLGTMFFLIPYNLIMYGINDVFDYESDIRNPRKGGIEGAVAAKRLHKPILWSCALLGLSFLAGLLWLGTWAANLVLAGVLFMVVAYSAPYLRFKERPLIDSITSSSHFCGPLVYGLVAAGWPDRVWPVVIAFFLWGMASHALGAIQDIIPDRAGKIASIATHFGAAWTMRLVLACYALSGLLIGVYGWPVWPFGLVAGLYIANCWPYRQVTDATSESVNRAWRRFIYINLIAGFLLTQLLIVLWFQK